MAYRMTKTERIARERMNYHMLLMEKDDGLIDGLIDGKIRELVPEAWHTLETDLDCDEPKEKVTLYLDRSVVRAFRAMGKGYHGRINRLLQTWLQMKIAGRLDMEAMLEKRYWELSKKIVTADKAGETPPNIADDGSEWPKEEPGEW